MKPIVDGLRKQYEGKVEFRIYNVDSPGSEGVELANKMGIQYVPTFVFANADGSIVEQKVGELSKDTLVAKLNALK